MQPLLAELLLRRKELQLKVDQLHGIRRDELFKQVIRRKKISEEIDDIVAEVPLLSAAQVTAEYDFYAKQLRIIDAKIQYANWNTQVDVEPKLVLEDYKPPTMVRPEAMVPSQPAITTAG